MTIEIDLRASAGDAGRAAPVAMQRGGRSDRIASARLRRERRWPVRELIRDRDAMRARGGLVAGLVAELETSRIESVAFVVQSDVSWTFPLYDLAITTARRGWSLGIPAARYWLITPEPQPLTALGAAMSAVAERATSRPSAS